MNISDVESKSFVMFHVSDNVWRMQGSYSLKMKMYDAANKELTCIGFDFDIGFASSLADS